MRNTRSRSLDIAFVALTTALMAVSAWVTVPLGPVPFTLQTFVQAFALTALSRRQACATAGLYLLMGAVGLPVFSGMRGGIGVLLGPTGGFLWGYLLGTLLVCGADVLVRRARESRGAARAAADGAAASAQPRGAAVDFVRAFAMLAVVYVLGWLQLAAVSGMGLAAAFAAGVAPFVVVDIVKIAVAVPCARTVRRAVSPAGQAGA